jgi:VWFA-related protein
MPWVSVPTGAGQQTAPPRFASAVESVRVDVVVWDSEGKPVTGLGREDFVVREDGVVQRIVDFEAVDDRRLVDRASGARKPAPAAGLGPAGAEAAVHSAAFVIVFDEAHLTAEEARNARRFASELLDSIRAEDRVTLVAMHDGRWWSAVGPEEAHELARQLATLGGRRTRSWSDPSVTPYEAMRIVQGDREVEQIVQRRFDARRGLDGPQRGASAPSGYVPDPQVQMRARVVYDEALQNSRLLARMGEALDRLPPGRGRTSLVVASGGFLVEPQLSEYRDLVSRCVRSGVSVYFYDARGMTLGPDVGAETGGRASGAKGGFAPDHEQRRDQEQRLQAQAVDGDGSGARRLTEDTGGFTIRISDEAGLARLLSDVRHYYVLGYAPVNAALDGGLRQIAVEVRGPRLSVRARKAYYAATEADRRLATRAPAPPPATPDRRAPALSKYLALVEHHGDPGETASLEALGQWELDALRRAAAGAISDPSCAQACARTAVLMHTEAAIRHLEAGDGIAADAQRDIAASLVRRLRESRDDAAFERLWLQTLGEKELDLGRIPDAVRMFDALVKQYPEDAEARLARGRAYEVGLFVLSLGARRSRADQPLLSSAGFEYNRRSDPRAPRGVAPSAPPEETHAHAAIESYRQALRLDPSLVEARLRLGRLLAREGQDHEARRELLAVAAAPRPEASYLAHLFLSRVEDEAGRMADAVAHARAAAAQRPNWQAAQLALAELLERTGEAAEASRIVSLAVAVPDRPANEDGWLVYHFGAYGRAATALDALRAMARP